MNHKVTGQCIRHLREKKHWSLSDLSKATGITHDHIGRIERGEVENFTIKTLDKIAEALQVEVTELIAPKLSESQDS